MRAWRAGTVAIANTPGAGVADDKAIYAYVPDMIRYYLGETALVKNVPTYLCRNPKIENTYCKTLLQLVVKPVNESGGYGGCCWSPKQQRRGQARGRLGCSKTRQLRCPANPLPFNPYCRFDWPEPTTPQIYDPLFFRARTSG